MVSTITTAFIEEYNAEVHLKFRQMGSRLTNMTRKGTVIGSTVHFQVFGTLVAQTKVRNAMHTFQDPTHTRVDVTMADFYVPTLVDDLDLLKINIDEKASHATAQVAALGKKADSVIMTAMRAGANAVDLGDVTKPFNYNMAMGVVSQFNVAEVPDDGQRYCALHPYAWAQLLQVPEFVQLDWVGPDQLPFKGGMQAKNWLGVTFMPLNNVFFSTGDALAANVAGNIAWHRSVVGHGVNKEIDTQWDYENTYSAWSCVSAMSLGTGVIEDTGVYKVSSLSPKPVP